MMSQITNDDSNKETTHEEKKSPPFLHKLLFHSTLFFRLIS